MNITATELNKKLLPLRAKLHAILAPYDLQNAPLDAELKVKLIDMYFETNNHIHGGYEHDADTAARLVYECSQIWYALAVLADILAQDPLDLRIYVEGGETLADGSKLSTEAFSDEMKNIAKTYHCEVYTVHDVREHEPRDTAWFTPSEKTNLGELFLLITTVGYKATRVFKELDILAS